MDRCALFQNRTDHGNPAASVRYLCENTKLSVSLPSGDKLLPPFAGSPSSSEHGPWMAAAPEQLHGGASWFGSVEKNFLTRVEAVAATDPRLHGGVRQGTLNL
jgi:hypothetical protein